MGIKFCEDLFSQVSNFAISYNREKRAKLKTNKTLLSVHFGVVVVELINCKCGGIVRNEIW